MSIPKVSFIDSRVRFSGLLTAAGVLVSGATLIGFLGRFYWFFELFSHFRVQYFLSLLFISIFLLFYKKIRWAFCFTGFTLINLALIIPLYWGNEVSDEKRGYTFILFLLNINSQNEEYDRVTKAIRHSNPDFIVLLEMTARWIEELESLQKDYPYFILEAREDNFGIAIYSRWPPVKFRTLWIGAAGMPSLLMETKTNNGLFSLLATHPLPPVSGGHARLRNQQLIAIARFVDAYPGPLLLAGDLNLSPWSPYFRQLLRDTGLENSARGYGVMPTWPANNPLFRVPIDHVLYSSGIIIKDRRTGSAVGSDHYPVVVDFSVMEEH